MEIPSRPAQSQLSCAMEAAVARHALSCAEKKKKKKFMKLYLLNLGFRCCALAGIMKSTQAADSGENTRGFLSQGFFFPFFLG